MKLKKVAIKNFRSIKQVAFTLESYSLLIGANNCGKSTVIDAIRVFYEKDKYKYTESDKPHGSSKIDPAWIELTYQLTDEEFDTLPEKYQQADKSLKLRRHLSGKSEIGQKAGDIHGYLSDGTLEKSPFHGSVQQGKLGEIVYIPAVSKVEDQTKLSGPSPLRDLISQLTGDILESSKEFGDFARSTEQLAGAMKSTSTDDGRSLSGLESELNKALEPWGADFAINLAPPRTQDIIKSMVTQQFRDHASGDPVEVDANKFGSGFQRHFIYSLIELQSRMKAPRPKPKKKEFSPNMTLLLFEEPEAFLHPPQQESLSRNLRKMASSASRQVLCSTHSAHFVSRSASELPAMVRLSRTKGICSSAQIDQDRWNTICDNNQQINKLAEKWPKGWRPDESDFAASMEAVKYCLWLSPDRASAFFANRVLLVEGPTELALLNRLIDEGKVEPPTGGLHVMDCMGKFNIHRFMGLMGALGIPHAVIYDDDEGKGVQHTDLNYLIDNSRNEYTLEITAINKDLEQLLGAKLSSQTHRKPQHLMHLYQMGEIDQNNLEAFCGLVRGALKL
jgi:predicted ATP-dependent endonuclease of OLD family